MNHKPMKVSRIILLLCMLHSFAQAQRITPANFSSLIAKEDSLKNYAFEIVNGKDAATRFRSDSMFTRMLVRALRTPYSFQFPFDSLITISRLYSPDSTFRIFTWQVSADEAVFRRHGAIQMRTKDGSLKLFPLIDRTALIQNQRDTITNHEWWIGSIYYQVIHKKAGAKDYYTLLGYDENSIRSTRKRMEVLTFDEQQRPVFGSPVITFEEDTVKRPTVSRFDIEYKKEGNARFRWEEEMDMILYDHLISETNEPGKKYTYIPDGDYEGFQWKNGKWVHIEKVFNFKLKDGEAPVINPKFENEPSSDTEKKKPAPKKPKTGNG